MSFAGDLAFSRRFWAATCIIGAAAIWKYAPGYLIWRSVVWTASILFLFEQFLSATYQVILYPLFLSPLRHLPEPSGNSLFNGQFHAIRSEPSGIPQRRWINTIPNNGLIRYKYMFNQERLLITNAKALSEVLTTNSYTYIKPPEVRVGLGRLLGVGVLLAEGEEHKHQRRSLAPAFSFRHIKDLYPVFWAKSVELVQALQKDMEARKDNSEEIGDWVSRATLDIIGLAGMGQDFEAIKDPTNDLNQTYRKIFSPSKSQQILAMLSLFLPDWLTQNLPVKRNEDIMAAAGLARATSRRLIRQKKEQLEKNEGNNRDIITVALASGGFTEENLVDQMMTFLAAGHETTASSMQWAIHLLSLHPEMQSRLRKEIYDKISSLEDSISANKLDHMHYLHAVCNEVLRFYAPVPRTFRDTAHDTTIVGHLVPKGTRIILSPWAVNFSTEMWGPDAADFNPDRWLKSGQANSGGATSNYAFLTFLHGPRSCIGRDFAKSEFACLLAAFVGYFEFEKVDLNEDIEIKGGATARPKNGMNVKLKHLDW